MSRLLAVQSILGALALGLTMPAHATEPPCTLIANAKVVLPGGVSAERDVLIEGGRILEVRPAGGEPALERCAAPRVAHFIEARGRLLTAGFIDPWTSLGLVEVSGEASTVDTDLSNLHQDTQGAVRAAVRASLAYNPRSLAIPVARAGGVTSALVVPSGGIISGGAFWVDLAGGTRAAIGREPAAMIASPGALSESRAAGMYVIDLALREALLWEKERGPWQRRQRADFATRPLDLEALGPVVRGEVPLTVSANRASDLEALLAMTEGTRVRLVIVGGAEAWLVGEALAARDVPVVVDPLLFGPGGFDALRARPDNAALLHRAGVKVMMSAFDTHKVRRLRQVAGNAVREGLPWEAALRGVTEVPADVFGLKDHGRVAPGAVANLVLWSGDPLELSTRVERVIIGGREIPLATRQTELFERWRSVPR